MEQLGCVLWFPGEDTYALIAGTSGATAHISGLAALMLAEQPSLTPAAIKTIIKESARPFVDSDCNTAKCGAGLADAAAALRAASGPGMKKGGMFVLFDEILHSTRLWWCVGVLPPPPTPYPPAPFSCEFWEEALVGY